MTAGKGQPTGYGDPVTWSVTKVVPDTQFGPSGEVIPGKQVTFTTSSGYQGTAFIPNTQFGNQQFIRDVIESEVKAVLSAQSMTGTIQG